MINGATYNSNVPAQSCPLTNIYGCDSIAVLNLALVSCESLAALCGEGTVWDSETHECIVANPTDTNFDGCTDLNDLMDILANYGDCAVVETNYSLSFDGVDDYLLIDHNNVVMFENISSSISFWIKTPTLTYNQNQPIIIFASPNNSNIMEFKLWDSNNDVPGVIQGSGEGKLCFHLRDDGNNLYYHLSSNNRIDDDQWHYVVGSVDNSTNQIYLYVDGVVNDIQSI